MLVPWSPPPFTRCLWLGGRHSQDRQTHSRLCRSYAAQTSYPRSHSRKSSQDSRCVRLPPFPGVLPAESNPLRGLGCIQFVSATAGVEPAPHSLVSPHGWCLPLRGYVCWRLDACRRDQHGIGAKPPAGQESTTLRVLSRFVIRSMS